MVVALHKEGVMMGILDPDEGRIGRSTTYQDPFLRPGFKPDDARPPPIVDKPPPEEKPEPENLPTQLTPEQQAAISGVGIFEGSDPVTNQEEKESEPFDLTDDQRYMLIGLAVLGAFFGFFKK